ncbi:putative exportin-1/Importin-beta [Medicago truncatula]|uniref:HASTY-like protein n=1 Tax=Medicago truncatula TaxID=3880 RepID=G7L0R1_MEDTR|nr:protein HASTY 1 [Medicago truncatula]AES82582.1 HASTY-like protein [Medicago truncatula]RHN49352.1 putative exportin-1/Importin-beta [Medicago truncatula]
MEDSSVHNVAQAIATALNWSSTPDSRQQALSFLDSMKASGDIRTLANTLFLLVKRNWSSEIRLHAFKMLQHLVRLRWEELSSEEHKNFAKLSMDLMYDIADPSENWALKSQTAALVAEIVRREGLDLWREIHPSLVTLSSKGPIQAELVSMMLRWLPEDITVHNEDLEGERRRLLLRGLTESLPEILPLLYSLLERHFVAALNEAGRKQTDIAKLHAAAVTAALNAIIAYAEWAPLTDLSKSGIINGCGFLLSAPDFRLHASDFFKLVSSRKRSVDASASEIDQVMREIFQLLMNISRDFLYKSGSVPGSVDEGEYEFAECVCECMVLLGSFNLQSIAGDSSILSLYLEQMLGFFKNYKFAIHFQSLQFWLVLMRDLLSKPKNSTHSAADSSAASGSGSENAKKKTLSFVNDDFCGVMLDTSFPRMLKREKILPGTALSLGALELWSDDFEDKSKFSQYRSRLLELIRFVASHKPLIAAAKVSEKVDIVIKNFLVSPVATQDLAVVESMQLALENVVNAVFDRSNNDIAEANAEVQFALCRTFEGLLQQFISLKWKEPALVEVLVRYLEGMGLFLKYFPDAAGSVINKLFELLTSLPFEIKDPSTSSARHARLQICTSFIRIAKAADKSILPHMKGIADTISCLQREGRLLQGEHNLIGEAFLIMASSAGIQQQQEVLKWLLEPLSQQWIQLEWQDKYLSNPHGLVQLCSEAPVMWSIFHTVALFERALKRSGLKKAHGNLENSSASDSTPLNPMAPHVLWMLTPLLKLLRGLHSLWSLSISQTLPGEIKAAMAMSDFERFSLLGEENPKLPKNPKEGYGEPNGSDIRNWFKGIRDSGYNVLGLSTTVGDSFFKNLDAHSVAVALMENIQSMEFRHLRLLVHSILIPLVKHCPVDMREIWLEKLLHPLFVHVQQALSCSWSSLLQDGRAKVPDIHGILIGSDLKVEVMEEKILRDLTREMCSLLSVIASPPLNTGFPSLEQSGHIIRFDMSSVKSLDAVASCSLVGFLLKHESLALPTLRMCLEVFTWTDGEAVTKISSFCSTMVVISIVTNHTELIEYVSRDLFTSVIQGLSLESNAIISSDLVAICREIFVNLCDRHPAPRQILQSLPFVTPHDLHAFEESLSKTSSPKEQKQHMKSLLLLATGNKLKALAAQKSVNIITNVSMRPRSSASAPESNVHDGDVVGLAAMI